MTGHWFRPRRFGYGATPANWKGWVATMLFLIVMLGSSYWFIFGPELAGNPPGLVDTLTWAGLIAVVLIGYVALCRAKTDGEWRWRWGE